MSASSASAVPQDLEPAIGEGEASAPENARAETVLLDFHATEVARASGERPPKHQLWRRRDWLLVVSAAAAGLITAAVIVRRG